MKWALNTFHKKDDKPFALVPYILGNLKPESPFSAIVKEVLDKHKPAANPLSDHPWPIDTDDDHDEPPLKKRKIN